MSSNQRARIAGETLHILDVGHYDTPFGRVELNEAMAACLAGTRLYTPEQQEALVAARRPTPPRAGRVSISGESTLAATRRLAGPEVGALNFASARNPGGGFLNGAHAQEESIARSSGLYPSLMKCPAFYAVNRRQSSLLYTDHLILSPDVPIFRDDEGALLPSAYTTTVLTSPAPNAGAMRADDSDRRKIRATLVRRTSYLFAVAMQAKLRVLVLGAWGCGAFRNDGTMVAEVFAELLRGPFAGAFDDVLFAILDTSRDQRYRRPFEQVLG